MNVDKWIDLVGSAYGEPGGEIAEALFTLVHEVYDERLTVHEQAELLIAAVGRVKMRLHRVTSALYHMTAEELEPLEEDDASF